MSPALTLYNTLRRTKEVFEPLDPTNVRMYVCGPTVYDYAHIGNARPAIIFDVLYRLLRHRYGDACVTYVRNITDVDDKINAAARDSGEQIGSITARTTEIYHTDMAALGALPPDIEPRATEHIEQMIAMIETLLGTGNAYAEDGHVLFSVPSWDGYGRLSRHNRDEQIAGARVEVAPYKRDPADFVLWKPSAADMPGWESPWGRGRPGWHIECSAMSTHYLGNTFDIHGGGQDLIFPHHENEIAQSACAHPDDDFARLWIHNGYLMVEGEKMSKSLGNFYTVNDLLGEFPGEAIRLALLQTHYRQPMDFTKDGIAQAHQTLDRFYGALRKVTDISPVDDDKPTTEVMGAFEDDLNTPFVMHHLHHLLSTLNHAIEQGSSATRQTEKIAKTKGSILAGGAILGILQRDPESWFKDRPDAADAPDAAEIEALIAARAQARTDKNFAEADRIRDQLTTQGVVLEDGAGGTLWKRV